MLNQGAGMDGHMVVALCLSLPEFACSTKRETCGSLESIWGRIHAHSDGTLHSHTYQVAAAIRIDTDSIPGRIPGHQVALPLDQGDSSWLLSIEFDRDIYPWHRAQSRKNSDGPSKYAIYNQRAACMQINPMRIASRTRPSRTNPMPFT